MTERATGEMRCSATRVGHLGVGAFLSEVITDVIETQRALRSALQGPGRIIAISTMLHWTAMRDPLLTRIRVAVVDVNAAAVTKLADRGSWQALGLVTDAELLLRGLCDELGLRG